MIGSVLAFLDRVFFRPAAWLAWAALLLAVFGLVHLLGWRDATSILSGTLAPGGGDAMILRGLIYAAAYFGAVLVSPILVIAAGLYAVLARIVPPPASRATLDGTD